MACITRVDGVVQWRYNGIIKRQEEHTMGEIKQTIIRTLRANFGENRDEFCLII